MVEQAKMLCYVADHKGAEWTTENASTICAVLELVVRDVRLHRMLQTLIDKAHAREDLDPEDEY